MAAPGDGQPVPGPAAGILAEAGDRAAAPEERTALDAVMALPEQYRLPIHLHYYEGYSVAEMAEILKLGQSAAKMRLKRGRELLKMELEGAL